MSLGEDPSRIGELEVIRRIGAGGFGVVYLANDRRLGRKVAVKLAHRGRGDLWREARAAARLQHPNVVAIHEIGDHEGSPYLVMEHVDGPTLRDRIDQGQIPLADALRIARELASAIAAAHREGIIHLDLTPSNVLLAPDGRARVVDFGLARASDTFGARVDNLAEPQLSIAAGTPTYMAPEQWRAEKLGPPADVWALGAITHVLVTGAPPVDGSSELVRDRVAGAAPIELTSDLPATLAALLKRCLQKDPAARPLASEVATELDALLADLHQPAPFRDPPCTRTELVASLVSAVERERVVTVIGAGKSKLVQAAVISLREAGWKVAVVRLGDRPLHAIASALRTSVSGAAVATRDDLGDQPTTVDEQVALWSSAPERFAADLDDVAAAVGRFALVIDPIDQLDAAASNALTAAIADDGAARLVLVARDVAGHGHRFAIPPPSHAELVAMIAQPIRAAGYRIDDELADAVARDLASAPFARINEVGATLWDARDRETKTIPRRAYASRRRRPRFLVAGAAAAVAAAAATIAILAGTHSPSTSNAAVAVGPQCADPYFPKRQISSVFSANGLQDALAGVSADGNSVLMHRRDCTKENDWRILLVDDGAPPTTHVLSALPALAELDPEEGWIGLSGDALTVIGTDRTHTRMLASSRSARGRADFAPLAPGPFAAITSTPPLWISHPVLSQEGLEFFYTINDPTNKERPIWIHHSRRASTTEPFPAGTPMPPAFHNLEYVTGITADRRTLFVGTGYGVTLYTRKTLNDPFENPNFPIQAPGVPGFRTRPIGDCSRLMGTCTNGCNSEENCIFSR